MALWAASACRARRCRHHLLPAAGPCAYLPDAAARTARGKEACAWSLRHSGTAWFGEGPAPSAAAQRRGQSRYNYPGRTVRGRTRNLAGATAGSPADAPTTSRIHQPGAALRHARADPVRRLMAAGHACWLVIAGASCGEPSTFLGRFANTSCLLASPGSGSNARNFLFPRISSAG